MTNLMKIEQNLTMSTLEIAELTNKRHDNVMEDTRKMLIELELAAPDFSGTAQYKVNNAVRTRDIFNLPKRETLILVSGYNLSMRAKIIDRWQELELKQNQPSFAIPQTMSEALILAGQQMQLAEERKLQLELAKPKVDFVNKYVERDVTKNLTSVAKEMEISAKVLGAWLREEGHAFKSTDKLVWTKPFIDSGYGVHKHFSTEKKAGSQALITPDGDLFIKKMYKA